MKAMKRSEGGRETDLQVSRQAPPEHQQDYEDDSGLQEEAGQELRPQVISTSFR